MITIKELKDWIRTEGLKDDTIIGMDKNGSTLLVYDWPECWFEIGKMPTIDDILEYVRNAEQSARVDIVRAMMWNGVRESARNGARIQPGARNGARMIKSARKDGDKWKELCVKIMDITKPPEVKSGNS